MFQNYKISDFLKITGDFNPNKSANKSLFHINRLEEMPPLPEHIITPHKHHFYELFLVESGEAIHAVDYKEYKLHENTFFFISQGQLHFWAKTNREKIRGYRLMFTEDFFQMNEINNQFLFELIHLDNIYQNPFITLSIEKNKLIYTYFELIFQEYNRESYYPKALQSLLFLLLAEIHRLYELTSPTNTIKHQAVIFKQFIVLLEVHFCEKWSASNFAHALHISPRHLNRIVQNMTNQSLSQVIQNRIVLEAQRLLTFTDLTVIQISHKLSFEDSAYFARYFRKVTGLSPTDFKNNMSEKYRE
jgi:AraC family transcriptional regulator, transcriptional activator of pobA